MFRHRIAVWPYVRPTLLFFIPSLSALDVGVNILALLITHTLLALLAHAQRAIPKRKVASVILN